jgi:hypothetical protein
MDRVAFFTDVERNRYARRRMRDAGKTLNDAIAEQERRCAAEIAACEESRLPRLAAGEAPEIVDREIANNIGAISEKYDAIIRRIFELVDRDREAAARGAGDFKFSGGLVGRDYYPAHAAQINKKATDPMLRVFSSKLPRGRDRPAIRGGKIRGVPLTGSNDKKYLERFGKKTLGEDSCWVETNPLMRGIIRIDIDTDFLNEAELIHKIRTLDCPLPNIIVWKKNATNIVAHPHLIYVLEDSVCWTEKGRPGPKRLFKTVQSTMIRRLASIGADPYGSSNSLRGKNPISPLNINVAVVPHPYRLGGDRASADNLSALLGLTREDYKIAGQRRTGTSNKIFSTTQDVAKYLIRHYHPLSSYRQKLVAGGYAPDPRMIDTGMLLDSFKRDLKKQVSDLLIGAIKSKSREDRLKTEKKIAEKCDSVADLFWATFDPSKEHSDERRHIMRHPDFKKQASSGARRAITMLNAATTIKAAQSAGAHFTAALKRDATISKLVQAAIDAGIDGAITADHIHLLVRETGVSRRQCYAYRAELPRAIDAELRRRAAAKRRRDATKAAQVRSITSRSSAINGVICRIIAASADSADIFAGRSAISSLVKKACLSSLDKNKSEPTGNTFSFAAGKLINNHYDDGAGGDAGLSAVIPDHLALNADRRDHIIRSAKLIHRQIENWRSNQVVDRANDFSASVRQDLANRRFSEQQRAATIKSNLSPWRDHDNFNDKDCETVYLVKLNSSMCSGQKLSVIATRTLDETNIFTRERIMVPAQIKYISERVGYAQMASKNKRYKITGYEFNDVEHSDLLKAA